ncbi:MAG: LysR family transcriptional regulator [Planctomycetes bacterium]|nr:LysR family transcriptional regulator [Planctomycetota bacterium]
MPGPLEMRDLEAFVAVAETGSFTAAAQRLLLTQPTVSARIASLEAALDAKLLDRGPGKVRPTPAGEILLSRARTLLRDREEAMKAVEDFLDRFQGTLRIGGSSIPGSFLLPKVLAELRSKHPGLRISLSVEDTDQILEALRRGEVELCVVGRAVEEEGLETAVVGEDEIVLVATPALAARFRASARPEDEALEEVPLVLREAGSGTRASALDALERAGVAVDRLHIVLEIGGNVAAREAALAGVGAAFLSRLAVEREIAEGRLAVLPVARAPLLRPLVLVTRAGRTLSPAARELVRLLAKGKRGA